MPNCAVFGCKNNNYNTRGTLIKYFGFPKTMELCAKWTNFCRRSDTINTKTATICSIHFSPSCHEKPLQHRLLNYSPLRYRSLKEDAVPTLCFSNGSSKKRERKIRSRKRLFLDAVFSMPSDLVPKEENLTEDLTVPENINCCACNECLCSCHIGKPSGRKPVKRRQPPIRIEKVWTEASKNSVSPKDLLIRLPGENEFVLVQDDVAPLQNIRRSPLRTAELQDVPKSNCKRSLKNVTRSTVRSEESNYQLKKLLSDSRKELESLNKTLLQLRERNSELESLNKTLLQLTYS